MTEQRGCAHNIPQGMLGRLRAKTARPARAQCPSHSLVLAHKAAVTLELKKRAKQTKSVYIARTAVT